MEIWTQHPRGDGRRAGRAPTCRWSRTSRRSASPSSARPRWCGTRHTGQPVYNAIVWQDTRTQDICDALRSGGRSTGSAPACPSPRTSAGRRCAGSWTTSTGARERAEAGDLLMGTIDTWLLWNLTGGSCTSPTRRTPRRTLLMDLDTLPGTRSSRPRSASRCRCCREIRSSSEVYGDGREPGVAARRADRRHPRRPAGGDVRPGVPGAGRGEEHLRHRQLPAAQHRHREGAQRQRPAHHRLLQDRRRSRRSTPSRDRSPSPAASCSGCATTCG